MRRRPRLRGVVLLAAGLAATPAAGAPCDASTPHWENMTMRVVRLVNDAGRSVHLTARIADSGAERAAGFQHLCPAVIASGAILFVFEREARAQFHMRNVHASLDIAFIAGDGRVLDVLTMMPAQQGLGELYSIDAPFRYALETRQGFFAEHGVSGGGARLDLDGLRASASTP